MKRPWMPMYWGDYFADTRHLNKLQHASYLLLIGHYWMTGSLPDDDAQLANITMSTPEEWRADRKVLKALFQDGWRHKRIDAELTRITTIRAKRAAAGSKGGMVASINRFRNRR